MKAHRYRAPAGRPFGCARRLRAAVKLPSRDAAGKRSGSVTRRVEPGKGVQLLRDEAREGVVGPRDAHELGVLQAAG